jgi:very-short-patch-repair endonuclease
MQRALAELASTTMTITRSELEERFLALLDAHRIRRPQTNQLIDGIEVDAVWREWRLVVELDGWAYHRTRQAFQRDRTRGNELVANGWTVLRFTYHDVMRRPAATAARIAQAAAATG